MKYCGLIPARYDSTRLPGKPLKLINGKSMIRRVYEAVTQWSKWDDVYVTTDNEQIEDECKKHNIPVIMTDKECPDCIDRCFQAAEKLADKNKTYDRYIIIQGDEPMFNFKSLDVDLSPEAVGFYTNASKEDFSNPNVVKVVINNNGKALYFSRASIPYDAAITRKTFAPIKPKKQVGIYSFTYEKLKTFNEIGPSYLEILEGVGLLRLIEYGDTLQMRYTPFKSQDVNTEQDLLELDAFLTKKEKTNERH